MPSCYLFLGLLCLLVALLIGVRRMLTYRRRVRQNARLPQPHRCICGYSLEGLELPRCPECGRLFGFTCTMDELGLTEEELRTLVDKKRKTKADTPDQK